MIGDLIGAGVGLFAAREQRRHEGRMQDKQFGHNMEMAKYAYSQDLEMWNRMNQYNTPSAQMDRYREAGLNPHMVAMKGNSGNATTMPQYQQVRSEHGKAGSGLAVGLDTLNAFTDLKIKNAQADNLRAQTDVQKGTAEKILTEIANAKTEGQRARIFNKYADELYRYTAEGARKQSEKLGADIDNVRASTDLVREQIIKTKGEAAWNSVKKQIDEWKYAYMTKNEANPDSPPMSQLLQQINYIIKTGMEAMKDLPWDQMWKILRHNIKTSIFGGL